MKNLFGFGKEKKKGLNDIWFHKMKFFSVAFQFHTYNRDRMWVEKFVWSSTNRGETNKFNRETNYEFEVVARQMQTTERSTV